MTVITVKSNMTHDPHLGRGVWLWGGLGGVIWFVWDYQRVWMSLGVGGCACGKCGSERWGPSLSKGQGHAQRAEYMAVQRVREVENASAALCVGGRVVVGRWRRGSEFQTQHMVRANGGGVGKRQRHGGNGVGKGEK